VEEDCCHVQVTPPCHYPVNTTTFCGPNKNSVFCYLKTLLISPPERVQRRPFFLIPEPFFVNLPTVTKDQVTKTDKCDRGKVKTIPSNLRLPPFHYFIFSPTIRATFSYNLVHNTKFSCYKKIERTSTFTGRWYCNTCNKQSQVATQHVLLNKLHENLARITCDLNPVNVTPPLICPKYSGPLVVVLMGSTVGYP